MKCIGVLVSSFGLGLSLLMCFCNVVNGSGLVVCMF